MTEPRLRPAVRALMIDPGDRILLANMRFPDGSEAWALPGGGIEPGEDNHTALRRELAEETGVPETFIGPQIWQYTYQFPDGVSTIWEGQTEAIYLVPCHEFEPAPAMSVAELRSEGLMELRWWALDDIADADGRFSPEPFVPLVADVLEHGAPPSPTVLTATRPL